MGVGVWDVVLGVARAIIGEWWVVVVKLVLLMLILYVEGEEVRKGCSVNKGAPFPLKLLSVL